MTYIQRKGNYTAIESINGKRVWFATKTPNKRLAEKRAKAYFQALREENLAAAEKLMNRNPSSITIGDLLDLYEKLATVKEEVHELHWFKRSIRGWVTCRLISWNMKVRKKMKQRKKYIPNPDNPVRKALRGEAI